MAIGKPLNRKNFQVAEAYGQSHQVAQDVPPVLPQENRYQALEPVQEVQEEIQQQYEEPQEAEEIEEVEEVEEVEQESRNEKVRESFQQIRKSKERAEQERDALMSQMLEMQAKYNNNKVEQKPVEEPDELDFDIAPEDLVEGKHLKKYYARVRAMEKKLNAYEAQSQELITSSRIKAQYPDFDLVFNNKTVNILNETHPGIANALRAIPNDYDKAVAAYEMIKNLGINEEIMKKAVVSTDRERALKNSVKPRPVSSVSPQQGDSPLSKANAFANGLTEELKEQLRKEMFQSRKEY